MAETKWVCCVPFGMNGETHDDRCLRDQAVNELIEAAEEVNRKFDPDMRNHFHFARLRKAIAILKGSTNV